MILYYSCMFKFTKRLAHTLKPYLTRLLLCLLWPVAMTCLCVPPVDVSFIKVEKSWKENTYPKPKGPTCSYDKEPIIHMCMSSFGSLWLWKMLTILARHWQTCFTAFSKINTFGILVVMSIQKNFTFFEILLYVHIWWHIRVLIIYVTHPRTQRLWILLTYLTNRIEQPSINTKCNPFHQILVLYIVYVNEIFECDSVLCTLRPEHSCPNFIFYFNTEHPICVFFRHDSAFATTWHVSRCWFDVIFIHQIFLYILYTYKYPSS